MWLALFLLLTREIARGALWMVALIKKPSEQDLQQLDLMAGC